MRQVHFTQQDAKSQVATKDFLRKHHDSNEPKDKSNMNSTSQHKREPAPSYRQSLDTLARIPIDPNSSEFRASRIDNFWLKVFPPTPKCYICQDKKETANLLSRSGCDHKVCGKCLIKVFERAVNDKKCMPPSFCPHGEVSPDMAPGLFDDVFLAQWNEKYFEYLERTMSL